MRDRRLVRGAARALPVVLCLLLLGSTGCRDALEELGILPEEDLEVELTGNNAFMHMKRDLSRQQTPDMQSVMSVISQRTSGKSSTDSADSFAPGEAVIGLLRKNVRQRKNIKHEGFNRFDFGGFYDFADRSNQRRFMQAPAPLDASTLSYDEYTISTVDYIPVRNQASRGTCAAFTGVAEIEYALLKKYGQLPTIDLSEQRFYYNSKPECQDSGCSLSEQGSWYGTGMENSVAAFDPDIPLEASCPYNPDLGDNDLQVPQASGCSDGAAKVLSLKYVTEPEEIARVLEEDDLPVPFASPLSLNWEINEGLITLADSDYSGDTSHAGGHAYLIVGYKKLPNMPEEGGMCFIIKNSWGTGWGVNGYSCMTLEWVRKWGYGFDHPVTMDVMLRDDVLAQYADADNIPYDEEQEDELSPYFDEDVYDDDTADYDAYEDEKDIPVPDPEPPVVEVVWNSGVLVGPGDELYRMEYAEAADTILVRGVVRQQDNLPTGVLELTLDDTFLEFEGDRVGERLDDTFLVCTGPYDLLCSLRFEVRENRFYIQFTNPEYRRVKKDEIPSGDWAGLFELAPGYDLQLRTPENVEDVLLSRYAYLRVDNPQSGSSDPLRLRIDEGDVRVMGVSVGNVTTNPGLCTGDYAKNCGVYLGAQALQVLPRY